MLRLAIVLALASCTHWTPIGPTSLRDEHALLVTGDRAYELQGAHLQGSDVVGAPTHLWQTGPCSSTPNAPDDYAVARCWRELAAPTPAAPVTIQQAAIRRVTAVRSWTGGTVVLTSAIVLGVVVIGVAIVGALAGGAT